MVGLVASRYGTCIMHSMKIDNKKQIICPRCYGEWAYDIEPDTGNPYTCYTCYNTGTVEALPNRSPFDEYVEYAEFQNNLEIESTMFAQYINLHDANWNYIEDPIY